MPKSHSNICSVHSCIKPIFTKSSGLCSAHYARNKKHGDPLGGRTPEGTGLAFLKEAIASNTDECIIWKWSIVKNSGYGKLQIDNKFWLAHRYVLTMTKGEPPKPKMDASHDFNGKPCTSRCCVNPRHLHWKTRSENHLDKNKHGTMPKGEDCYTNRAIITPDQALAIYNDPRTSHTEIAKDYPIGTKQVGSIRRGDGWSWLTMPDEIST